MGAGVLKPAFPFRNGRLAAGEVALEELAEWFGTPLYVYDAEVIRDRYRALSDAFRGLAPLIAYSVKANGNLALLGIMRELGAGADIVSGGELYRARAAGIPAERILFAGVGKTEAEIRYALEEGILALNVESGPELREIERIARDMGTRAPVALRLNPDIVSPTPHEYTRTGHLDTKFGVPASRMVALYRWAAACPSLDIRGIDVHIGSQISAIDPFLTAVDQVLEIVDVLAEEGIGLDFLDLGGGFGVAYDDEPGIALDRLSQALAGRLSGRDLRLVLEPGRFLVGEAGVLLTRVVYVKPGARKTFVIVDGGMTELIRPSHYGGFHRITPVSQREGATEAVVDVVGPICEAGDFLARDRTLPMPEAGDVLAVLTSGAYGFVMASNYNGRGRPAEVIVDQGEVVLVRERETWEDLVSGELLPE